MWGLFPPFLFFFLGHFQITFRDSPAGFLFGYIRRPGLTVNKIAMCIKRNRKAMANNVHKGAAGGGAGCSQRALRLHAACSANIGCGRGRVWGGLPAPLFFWAHLSWQPYSASVKTRYRNVLWVTFKTRYKSSAL